MLGAKFFFSVFIRSDVAFICSVVVTGAIFNNMDTALVVGKSTSDPFWKTSAAWWWYSSLSLDQSCMRKLNNLKCYLKLIATVCFHKRHEWTLNGSAAASNWNHQHIHAFSTGLGVCVPYLFLFGKLIFLPLSIYIRKSVSSPIWISF